MVPSSQPFRARNDVQVYIKVLYHSATRQYIIPWAQIVIAFPHVQLVKNGDTILPFLSDRGKPLELLINPLCIAYQENAVLKVVYDEDDQSLSNTLKSSFWPTRQFRRANHLVTEHRFLTAVSVANALSGYHPAIAVLSHTFLYQDDSKPRLFIVLPTRDNNTGGLLDEFRLYYLCECGEHSCNATMTTTTTVLKDTDIHLVDHGGYRIADPAAFFEKYGEYIQAILWMVKYGACAAGMVVSGLLQFGAMKGQESVEFKDKIDYTIRYLQLQRQQRQLYLDPARMPTFTLTTTTPSVAYVDAPTNSDPRALTKTWLENEKFNDLESLLEDHEYNSNINDDNKRNTTPANLRRITTTKEGHVRWMCAGHYNELYPQLSRERLNKLIRLNQGTFNIHTGIAIVKISTIAQAKAFYQLLSNVPFLQELHISLDWTQSTADLNDFVFAIQQSNLQKVELFAQCSTPNFLNDQPKVAHSHKQSQPIHLQLFYEDFRKVQLKNREGLAVQVRKWPNTTNTNALSLAGITQRDVSILFGVLRSAPHLTRISLDVDNFDFDHILDLTDAHIEQHKKIEKLSLFRKGGSFVNMSFESGRTIPSQTEATLPRLDLITSRIPLESITDLILTDKHTAAEFDVLVQLDLSHMSDPLVNLSRVDKIVTMYPLLSTLSFTVNDLDAAYRLIEPFIRRHERDMTVRLEHALGDHAIIRFQHSTDSANTCAASTIELCAPPIKQFKYLPLDKVETMTLPCRTHIYQHNEIIEVSQRCTSLKTLEIGIDNSLSLAAFCISLLPSIESIHLIKSRNEDYSTYHSFPLKRLNLAGKCLVSVIGGVSIVKTFFESNPQLTHVSFTVADIRRDLPAFLTSIKSLQGHQLLKFTLKDQAGSVASISFDKDNNNAITSYSLHLKSLTRQQDLQALDIPSVTDFVLTHQCPVNVQLDTLFQELATKCPRLESVDIHCGAKSLPTFFQLIDLPSLKTCVLRNTSGHVAPRLDLEEGYLNIGNELLPASLFPDLHRVLQSRPTISGLKILVESTFEAYEFITSLAAKMPWLEEVKISQQSVGHKMAISFADDVVAGSGRVWTVALEVRSLSQIPPFIFPLLNKLTVSGQILHWTSQDLDEIPFASCENLSSLELKCPPSQFPRILGSMHEVALMHTSLRHLKLWDGSRDNILIGAQIDDLDAIAIQLQQVRMLDFEYSLSELKALLQEYPLEIAHLDLDPKFNLRQAEIIDESLKLGKVKIRHIQWDISIIKDVQLFETMFQAVKRCHSDATASKMIPTVAFKICKQAVSRSATTLYLPATDNQKQRMLSTLGQFMTRFATHLTLVNSGLELFLPDLFVTELEALQELEIRANRYCPDDKFLQWLGSVFKRPTVQVPASSQLSGELVEGGERDDDEDSYDADFDFDDSMSSSIIFGDDSSPPPASIAAPTLAFAPNPPSPVPLIHLVPVALPTNSRRQPFRRLTLHNLRFTPPQWKVLLESMDFVSLRHLNLERVGFGDNEAQLLTTLYIDQVTRARKQREEKREREVIVGDSDDDDEEEREDEGECVVRLYTTSVTWSQIDSEHARLLRSGCSQLKFVLV
ncbi:hypothetical protein BGW39_001418 [Mortierella sp. 14UC]|nr:hypothetical protein BGW39_001418 [Mortierella sp. 14UC]